MTGPALKRLVITFTDDGMEYAVTYTHANELPNPGTKGRTTRAATLVRRGLEAALEGLRSGPEVWGGFGTNTRESTDVIMVERRENAA